MATRHITKRAIRSGLVVCNLLLAFPAFGNSVSVTNAFDSGPGSLRDAIAIALPGDTINVMVSGTVTLTSGPLLIRKNLTINGPGASNLAISGNDSSRVVTIDVTTADVAISGFTIRNGSADYGGGILNAGRLTLIDIVVSGHSALWNGGAIYNAGTLVLRNGTISGNSAAVYGGGLYIETGSAMTISNSVISGNAASIGGGITNHDGTLSLTTTSVSGNSAAGAYGGSGGGIMNGGLGGTVTIADSTISGNSASAEGGAIYHLSGTLTIVNSTISNNSCSCNNGGCSGGGGIYNLQSTAAISNTTFSNNVSSLSYLGGNIISLYGTTTVKNSLLAKGPSSPNCYTYFANSIVSQGHNLSDDASCSTFFTQGGDLNDEPAGLSTAGLQNNGGPTQTIGLLATSHAVDSVPSEACTDANGNLIADQRGVSRPQGGACDIGSFEVTFSRTVLALATPAPNAVVRGSTAPVTLAGTLTRQDDGGPIEGVTIAFEVDGTVVGTAITGATGAAILSYDPSLLIVGNHLLQGFFTRHTVGDVAFEASTSTTGILQVLPQPYAASVQPPINADGTSVFKNRGVVPVKFTLSNDGMATCQLPAATISLIQTAGETVGPINESTYAFAADSSSSFRIDAAACQYVFNLGTNSLGTGTYSVSISIGGKIVGHGAFGLR